MRLAAKVTTVVQIRYKAQGPRHYANKHFFSLLALIGATKDAVNHADYEVGGLV